MSIIPYNNYTVKDLSTPPVQQPYVNSTTEFGYFGNLGTTIKTGSPTTYFSMPTFLLTNNGIASVDTSVNGFTGLKILQKGIYKLNLSLECTSNSGTQLYFNFGVAPMNNSPLSGSFGGTMNSGSGMYSYNSSSTYPRILSWVSGSGTVPPQSAVAGDVWWSDQNNTNNQLVYVFNTSATTPAANSPTIPICVCSSEITFCVNGPTTIYFNTASNPVNTSYMMGTSYFLLQLISNVIIPTIPTMRWTQSTQPASNYNWRSIASSSNGQYLIAGVYSGTGQGLYVSTNYGVYNSWTAVTNTPSAWCGVASNSSGSQLVAAALGNISRATLNNNGTYTWNLITPPISSTNNTTVNWYSIASDSSGQYLACTANSTTNTNANGIWTSTANPPTTASWTKVTTGLATNVYPNWFCIASSSSTAPGATGPYLAAVIYGGSGTAANSPSGIWTNFNGNTGGTFNSWKRSNAIAAAWTSIASDETGQYFVAVVYGGTIWRSTDRGSNWNQVTGTGLPATANWNSITSSSNGTFLTAVAFNQGIWSSINSGTTWTKNNSNLFSWKAVASSGDGTRVVAATSLGDGSNAQGIWTGLYS